MAYARWSQTSDWYIFWEESTSGVREEQCLAIRHCDRKYERLSFAYAQVQAMLKAQDFRGIPGYRDKDEQQIREALEAFVVDVDVSDETSEADHLWTRLGTELARYLALPSEQSEAQRIICAVLSRLLQDRLRTEPSWDSKFAWLDGILPIRVVVRQNTFELSGGVLVVNGAKTILGPIKASVSLDPGTDQAQSLRVYFLDSSEKPLPYEHESALAKLRIPEAPAAWRYSFKW